MSVQIVALKNWLTRKEVFFGIVVVVFAYFTYVHNYTNPPYLFWDENYHISSAQKYLNGVYFMEQHPPLAKMLIALGEKIVDANVEDNGFIGTDYARDLPADFSFAGYRLFPVLFAWATAIFFYLIFLQITKSALSSLLFSFLYIFDNAIIVHSRSAMLDSILFSLCVLLILIYYYLLKHKDHPNRFPLFSLLFGVVFGLILTTKVLGLIMVLLIPVLFVQILDWPDFLKLKGKGWKQIGQFSALAGAGFIITYAAVWQTHFSIGKMLVPSLPDQGYYQASEQYKALIDTDRTNFPIMLRDSLKFVKHYNNGVPQLNLCKADENGSPFFLWPFGGRSINFRWETPNGIAYQYLYLVINPTIWILSVLGILGAVILLAGSWILPGAKPLQNRWHLTYWFGMYASYMIAISQIGRVMYLYHYFLALLFSFILFVYVFQELKQLGVFKLTESRKNWILLSLGVLIFLSFQFYRPLSYYIPLSDEQFKKRMIFPIWELHCVNCPRGSLYATPIPK